MYADVSPFFPFGFRGNKRTAPHPLEHRAERAADLERRVEPGQMYRYDPSKNEWRKFSSPTQPGPRAAHQMVGTVAGGGRLWVHGGEYCEWGRRAFSSGA